MRTKIYAMYRGDENICDGTIAEIARRRHVQPATIRYYLMPAYQRKLAKRQHSCNAICLIEIDEQNTSEDDDNEEATKNYISN